LNHARASRSPERAAP